MTDRPPLQWAIVAMITVAIVQLAHSHAVGGYAGLLRPGADSDARAIIESELPGAPVHPMGGHDGHIFYIIGLDPWGTVGPDYLEEGTAAYRYRRIGYPLMSSLGGVIDGLPLLASMVFTSILSAGVAAGAAALIARETNASTWLALGVGLNPGVWLSTLLLTADNVALALGLLGIHGYLRGRRGWAVVALAGAALTKEVAILFAVGLVGHALVRRELRCAAILALGSAAPLVGWLTYVHLSIGNILTTTGHAGPPFEGIIEASRVWPAQTVLENTFLAILGAFIVAAVVGLRRAPALWRWLTWPWIGLAVLLSHYVWDLGNNAIRTLSPIIALTVLGVGIRAASQEATDPESLFSASASP